MLLAHAAIRTLASAVLPFVRARICCFVDIEGLGWLVGSFGRELGSEVLSERACFLLCG